MDDESNQRRWFWTLLTKDIDVIRELSPSMRGQNNGNGTLLWQVIVFSRKLQFQRNIVKILQQYPEERINGLTPAMIAAFLGDRQQLECLSEDQYMQIDEYQNNLLHYATLGQNIQQLPRIPDQFYRQKGFRRFTALVMSAKKGLFENVRYLAEKEHGETDERGRTAFWIALWETKPCKESKTCVGTLMQYNDEKICGETDTMIWAYLDRIDMLSKCTIEEIMMQDEEGNNAIHYATVGQSYRAARYLRRYLQQENIDGKKSALQQAVLLTDVEMVKILKPYEAGFADEQGTTALMSCGSSGDQHILRQLQVLEGSMRDDCGKTACQVIAMQRSLPHKTGLRIDRNCGWVSQTRDVNAMSHWLHALEKSYIFYKEACMSEKQFKLWDQARRLESFSSNGDTIQRIPLAQDWQYKQVMHQNFFNKRILRQAVEIYDDMRAQLVHNVHVVTIKHKIVQKNIYLISFQDIVEKQLMTAASM